MLGHKRLMNDDVITKFSLIRRTGHSMLSLAPDPPLIGMTVAEYEKSHGDCVYQAEDFILVTPHLCCRKLNELEPVRAQDYDASGRHVASIDVGTPPKDPTYRAWYMLPEPFAYLNSKDKVAYYENKTFWETERSMANSGDLVVNMDWHTVHLISHAGARKDGSKKIFTPALELDFTEPKAKEPAKPQTEHDRMYQFFFGKKGNYP